MGAVMRAKNLEAIAIRDGNRDGYKENAAGGGKGEKLGKSHHCVRRGKERGRHFTEFLFNETQKLRWSPKSAWSGRLLVIELGRKT